MKKLLILLFLVLVLGIPMSLVSAQVVTANGCYAARGAGTHNVSEVAGEFAAKKESSDRMTPGCVNLTSFWAPGVPNNYVGYNLLVFRLYTTDGTQATDSVNYKYCTAGDCKKYMYYDSRYAGLNTYYFLKNSLNSGSQSAYAWYSIRWNP